MEDDLRVCLVRPLMDIDRRFCFEIISPSKSHVLQADTEESAKRWITCLQQGISSALHNTMVERSANQDQDHVLKWDDSDNEEGGGEKAKPASAKAKLAGQHLLKIPGAFFGVLT